MPRIQPSKKSNKPVQAQNNQAKVVQQGILESVSFTKLFPSIESTLSTISFES